jgi:hypothetical protein
MRDLSPSKEPRDMLEGYTYDEPWPDHASAFSLRYRAHPRNLKALNPDRSHEEGKA